MVRGTCAAVVSVLSSGGRDCGDAHAVETDAFQTDLTHELGRPYLVVFAAAVLV